MTNSTNDQSLAVSPQLTDYVLGWQNGQSPPSRKFTLAQVAAAGALPITGGALTGRLTISSGGITVSGASSIAGNTSITGNLSASGNISAANYGTVNGTTGAFNGALSAASGAFLGALSAGTITGVSYTGGPVHGTTIQGTTAVFSGNAQANAFLTVGSISSVSSGWSYLSAGPVAFGPQSVSYSFLAQGSSMLAVGYYAVSDVRLKLDIADVTETEAMAWLNSARPVTYRKLPTYGANPGTAVHEAGLIAQDQARAGYGRYVGVAPCEGMPERIDDDGFRSLPDVVLNLPLGYQLAFMARALKAAFDRIAALEAAAAAA